MTSSSDRPLHLIIRGILPVGIPTQGTSIGNRCLMQVTSTFNGYATSHCIPCCAALILIQVVSPGCLNHRSKKGKAQSAFTELWHLAMGLAQLDFLWSRLELCASKNATHMTPMEVLTGHSHGHCLAWKDTLGQCIESKAPEATKPFKNLHLEVFAAGVPDKWLEMFIPSPGLCLRVFHQEKSGSFTIFTIFQRLKDLQVMPIWPLNHHLGLQPAGNSASLPWWMNPKPPKSHKKVHPKQKF